MATGVLVEHLTAFTTPNLSASWVVGRERDGPVRDGIDLAPLSPGALTNNRPITIRSLALTGTRDIYTFVDDFYYRIHLIPPVIDFGAIANETDRTIQIWNAYFSSVSLDDVEGSGEITGITLSDLTPPVSFKPLEMRGITFTVPAEGPPAVEGEFTFTFSNGDELIAPAIGARARIWNHQPNWKNGVQIEYQFKTEILLSRSRREQRNALRMTPRKSITFTVHAAFAGMRSFNAKMAQWLSRPFIVPEYPRGLRLQSSMAASATSCVVDDVPAWLVEDMLMVINYRDTYETRTVDTIVGSTITFTTSTSSAFPAGSILYPGLRSHLQEKVGVKMHTNAVLSANVTFNVDPTSEADYDIGTADTVFDGREVFAKKHNWGESVSVDWEQFGETADFGRGKVDYISPVDFNIETYKMSFLGRDRDEVEELLQFFHRMRGAQGEFYRPTFQPDLIPKITALPATVFLRFAGVDVYDVYATDKINKAVYVKLRTGESQFNAVKEITVVEDVNGRDTVVEFDDPWSFAVDPDNTLMVSWMPVWRFASDNLTFEWQTDKVCTMQMQMQSLEALPAEAEPV
jgi:hypothetical protein